MGIVKEEIRMLYCGIQSCVCQCTIEWFVHIPRVEWKGTRIQAIVHFESGVGI